MLGQYKSMLKPWSRARVLILFVKIRVDQIFKKTWMSVELAFYLYIEILSQTFNET